MKDLQYFEQEQEFLSQLTEDTLQIVLSGYFTGTKFLYDQRYDIAIGCLTTAIGLCPLPYLYRLRAIAFMNRGLDRQALHDCDRYIRYHKAKNSERNERYMMDGLLMRGHIQLLSLDFVGAHQSFDELAQLGVRHRQWMSSHQHQQYYQTYQHQHGQHEQHDYYLNNDDGNMRNDEDDEKNNSKIQTIVEDLNYEKNENSTTAMTTTTIQGENSRQQNGPTPATTKELGEQQQQRELNMNMMNVMNVNMNMMNNGGDNNNNMMLMGGMTMMRHLNSGEMIPYNNENDDIDDLDEENDDGDDEDDDDEEDDDFKDVVEVMEMLCIITQQLSLISKMPSDQITPQMLKTRDEYSAKVCMYCEEYEQMIIQWEVEWIAIHHAEYLNTVNIDTPLSIVDIVKLASSTDINARSMGVVLMGGKFDGTSYGSSANSDVLDSEQEMIDLFVESGALTAISDSLRLPQYNTDSELRFFATKTLADICWAGNIDTRWQIVHEGFIPILCEQMQSHHHHHRHASIMNNVGDNSGSSSGGAGNDQGMMSEINESDDLVGITATTLGLLGRGGSGIDKVMREHGAIDAILKACHTMKPPNSDYCIQAISRLSGDTETKVLIICDRIFMSLVVQLVKDGLTSYATRLSTTKSALIILGNVCQNPEVWGYPHLYNQVEQTIRDFPELFSCLFEYVIGLRRHNNIPPSQAAATSNHSGNNQNKKNSKGNNNNSKDSRIRGIGGDINKREDRTEDDDEDPDIFQLRMYAINAITQLLGFKVIREGVESCGGEQVFYDILSSCHNSTLSQAITQAIRYYITLQHYGDHMKSALVPQYRLTPLSTITDTFDYVPSMMNSMSIPSLLDKSLKQKIRSPTGSPSAPSSPLSLISSSPHDHQTPTDDLLKILDMKIAKQQKSDDVSVITTTAKKSNHNVDDAVTSSDNPNDDSISNIVSGLLNMASLVWKNGATGPENSDKIQKPKQKQPPKQQQQQQPSKSKLKNQKKKQKKKAAKLEQKKLEEQRKQAAKQKKKEIEAQKLQQKSVAATTPTQTSEEEQQATTTTSTTTLLKSKSSEAIVEANVATPTAVVVDNRPAVDPFQLFLQEFQTGMTSLAEFLNWGIEWRDDCSCGFVSSKI